MYAEERLKAEIIQEAMAKSGEAIRPKQMALHAVEHRGSVSVWPVSSLSSANVATDTGAY
jgi:hypothetical protein